MMMWLVLIGAIAAHAALRFALVDDSWVFLTHEWATYGCA